MLTLDLLNANAALSSLTDDQKQAIVTISSNDEAAVIAAKTGEIYGGLDNDILATTGMGKNGTEKTYDYAKRVMSELKSKADNADALRTQVNSLTQKNASLEKSIAEGNGNEQLNKELKQAKADLASVTTQFNELQQKTKQMEDKFVQDLQNERIDSALQGAKANIKFRPELPESATKVLLQQAVDKIKGMNPELIETEQGRTLVFKDANGAILRNQATNLNPYTAAELLNRELEQMDVLDKGRQAAGGGTRTPNGSASTSAVSIDGAKTRTEAYEIITNILVAEGKQVGTAAFQEAMSQAWKDNNIAALPEK